MLEGDMKLGQLVLVAALTLASFQTLAKASPAQGYTPPIAHLPKTTPQAMFGQDVHTRKWCGFDLATWRARLAHDRIVTDEVAWISYSPKRLESISIESQSEDADALDTYFFDADGRVTRMIRTGHYISSPVASFTYVKNGRGQLVLTQGAREMVRRMNDAGYETYIIDWPRYPSLGSLPFGSLITVSKGVEVQLACASPHIRAPDKP